MREALGWLLGVCFLLGLSPLRAEVEQRLEVTLEPDAQRLEARVRVDLPAPAEGPLRLRLHAGLEPRVLDAGASLGRTARLEAAVPLQEYRLRLSPGARAFTLEYAGRIHHPVQQRGAEYARSFGVSPGLIDTQGIFLAGSSGWYPDLDQGLAGFELQLRLPADWRSVSQGRRSGEQALAGERVETWRSDTPQEEIYLIAAPYSEYSRPAGPAEAMVFLRQPDPALAGRYLDATAQYLALYQSLIGPYPYAKFALVENFWDTGYGMPSFTLLGPRVIRLPFILHSSYPHEILHNWWGNGVFVDYASGNWSEGLTSYLADHLIQEQRGRGAEYRRGSLQKYADHVRGGRDFPLTEFRARHSSATQAVGYGKALMLFHMLRRELGDAAFVDGLRRFYRERQFRVSGYADLERSFSAAAGRPLDGFFRPWLERTGAPALRLVDARAEADGDGYRLSARIEQTQSGPPYRLRLPLAVTLEGREQAYQAAVEIDRRRQEIELELPARPLHLAVDPEFDLFRRLDRREIPPALSQAFGAERALVLLPSSAPRGRLAGYRALAESWQRGRQLEIRLDRDFERLPADRAVWLFGWDNRFRPQLTQALVGYPFVDQGDRVEIAGETLARGERSLVAVARHPDNPEQALAWVAADNLAALPGLGRKLPHYGKYSYLAFAGDAPENRLKGQWPVPDSPLALALTDTQVTPAPLPPRAPLAEPPPGFSEQRLRADVEALSAPEMDGRGLGTPGLERAADYLAGQFAAAGLQPGGGDGGWFQRWRVRTGPNGKELELRNLIGLVPGSRPDLVGQSLVIGAHYDHLGFGWPDVHQEDAGQRHPGADDNASGLALLLELARHFAAREPERTLVFVAFSGEEAGRLGSRHYIQAGGEYPADQAIAMLNLDTVGRLEGRELLVLGTGSAREWPHIFRGAGYVAGLEVKAVGDDLGASDQRSFLEAGVPAVQLFSGPHPDYHRASDRADKLDYPGLLKTAALLSEVVGYLAARPEPLLSQLGSGAAASAPTTPGGEGRKVSLGTVPDFTYPGPGVRLSGVGAGSPADRAGLREGDVLLAIDAVELADLRAFAQALRALSPGQRVGLRFVRDGGERTGEAELVAR